MAPQQDDKTSHYGALTIDAPVEAKSGKPATLKFLVGLALVAVSVTAAVFAFTSPVVNQEVASVSDGTAPNSFVFPGDDRRRGEDCHCIQTCAKITGSPLGECQVAATGADKCFDYSGQKAYKKGDGNWYARCLVMAGRYDCYNFPCVNQGYCIDQVDGYSCWCPYGFTGKNCEKAIDECAEVTAAGKVPVCHSAAKCTNVKNRKAGEPSYTCKCNPGYFGDGYATDQTKVMFGSILATAKLKNGEENAYGWLKRDTSALIAGCMDIDDCGRTGGALAGEPLARDPCKNGAACSDTFATTGLPHDYTCACSGLEPQKKFQGKHCEQDVDECKAGLHNCAGSDSTTCTNNDGSFTCTCLSGFKGDGMVKKTVGQFFNLKTNAAFTNNEADQNTGCSDIVDCASNPCKNGATCSDAAPGSGLFTCKCVNGWRGARCGEDINECKTVGAGACNVLHAKCLNTAGSWKCICEAGWTGDATKVCVDLNDCDPNPCENGGTCTDLGTLAFACECKVGYRGTKCTDDWDECALGIHNCNKHALCTNTFGSYSCACVSGYSGDGTKDGRCDKVNTCATWEDKVKTCKATYEARTTWNEDSPVTLKECSRDSDCNTGDKCVGVAEDSLVDYKRRVLTATGTIDTTRSDGLIKKAHWMDDYMKVDKSGVMVDKCGKLNVQTNEFESHGTCRDVGQSYACTCLAGWTDSNCDRDVDECATGTHHCARYATCSNRAGPKKSTCTPQAQCVEAAATSVAADKLLCAAVGDLASGAACAKVYTTASAGADIKIRACKYISAAAADLVPYADCVEIASVSVPADLAKCVAATTEGACGAATLTADATQKACKWASDRNNCAAVINLGDASECEGVKTRATAALATKASACKFEKNWPEGYTCACNSGHLGDPYSKACEDIDDCAGVSVRCVNGQCSDMGVHSWSCSCADGWTDTRCDRDIDECAIESTKPFGAQCGKDSHCVNTDGSYRCECDPGYAGDGQVCQEINDCASNPCAHGKCTDHGIRGFGCTCEAGWMDHLCDFDWNECSFGVKGSDISNLMTHEEVLKLKASRNNGKVKCDPRARCVNSPGSYYCRCLSGMAGDGYTCTDLNDCDPNPCVAENTRHGFYKDNWGNTKKHSGCKDMGPNEYQCECKPGWCGTHCEVDCNECRDGTHDCDTNARCVNRSPVVAKTGAARQGWQCFCNTGYYGPMLRPGDIGNGRKENCHECTVCKTKPPVGGWKRSGACVTQDYKCVDVDECVLGRPVHRCDQNAKCLNLSPFNYANGNAIPWVVKGIKHTCECQPGYYSVNPNPTKGGRFCKKVTKCPRGTYMAAQATRWSDRVCRRVIPDGLYAIENNADSIAQCLTMWAEQGKVFPERYNWGGHYIANGKKSGDYSKNADACKDPVCGVCNYNSRNSRKNLELGNIAAWHFARIEKDDYLILSNADGKDYRCLGFDTTNAADGEPVMTYPQLMSWRGTSEPSNKGFCAVNDEITAAKVACTNDGGCAAITNGKCKKSMIYDGSWTTDGRGAKDLYACNKNACKLKYFCGFESVGGVSALERLKADGKWATIWNVHQLGCTGDKFHAGEAKEWFCAKAKYNRQFLLRSYADQARLANKDKTHYSYKTQCLYFPQPAEGGMGSSPRRVPSHVSDVYPGRWRGNAFVGDKTEDSECGFQPYPGLTQEQSLIKNKRAVFHLMQLAKPVPGQALVGLHDQ